MQGKNVNCCKFGFFCFCKELSHWQILHIFIVLYRLLLFDFLFPNVHLVFVSLFYMLIILFLLIQNQNHSQSSSQSTCVAFITSYFPYKEVKYKLLLSILAIGLGIHKQMTNSYVKMV